MYAVFDSEDHSPDMIPAALFSAFHIECLGAFGYHISLRMSEIHSVLRCDCFWGLGLILVCVSMSGGLG